MAVTHHFADSTNLEAGGIWKHDYGETICTRRWEKASRELTVSSGLHGKRFDLSGHAEPNFTEEKLRERLPKLAFGAAQKINQTTYDV